MQFLVIILTLTVVKLAPFFSYSFTLLLLPYTTQAKKEGGKKKGERKRLAVYINTIRT